MSWKIVGALPWIGSPFVAGQQMTDVVTGITTDVLQPSAELGTAIAPDRVLQQGRIDVETLRDQAPGLEGVAAAASRLDAAAQSIPEPTFISALKSARSALQAQTSDLASILKTTALAARVAPALMGADGPRTYFMGFQTNAEARGTGGLLGGFGLLRFDNGAFSVDTLATNTELDKQFTPLDLGPEYAQQWGFANTTTDPRNSNLTSHFPYVARIWSSMWQQQSGMTVDGAIAIDPIALKYILGAVGPVTLADGEVVNDGNVVELTESTAYIRYPLPADQPARKQYLQDVARAVVDKMTGQIKSPRSLLDALGRGVGEGRISVWSASPQEQAVLEQTPLAHIIPGDAAPYAAVVINNLAGNKLDYYVNREIAYRASGCDGDTRNSTVTVKLSSAVPPGLSNYASGTSGMTQRPGTTLPYGTVVSSVRLVGTKGATLRNVLSGGQPIPVLKGTELGHPTFEVQVGFTPGTSGDLTFNLTEPTSAGEARVPVQPLVDDVTPAVEVPVCGG